MNASAPPPRAALPASAVPPWGPAAPGAMGTWGARSPRAAVLGGHQGRRGDPGEVTTGQQRGAAALGAGLQSRRCRRADKLLAPSLGSRHNGRLLVLAQGNKSRYI